MFRRLIMALPLKRSLLMAKLCRFGLNDYPFVCEVGVNLVHNKNADLF